MTKTIALVAASLALLAPACADNQESLIVLNAPAWGEGCAVEAGNSGASLPYGVLDLAFPSPYIMPVLLFNNAGERGSTTNAGIETNELQLLDADVELTSRQAPEIIDAVRAVDPGYLSFNVPLATVSILPQQTQGVLVEVVPFATATALGDALADADYGDGARVTIEANVDFHASRTGNARGNVGAVDAREFRFPIQICFGCLTNCSGCPEGACRPEDFANRAGGVCGNAQDLPIYPAACEAPE